MRVWVTRPEPGASRTAERLRRRGHDAIVLPLSRTVAVPTAIDLSDAQAVAVTSANALRHADGALVARLRGLPCFAVGKATAEAALHAGFGTIRSGDGEAGSLASLIRPGDGPLAYLCGRVRRPEFEAALRGKGVAVRPVETYDTMPLMPSPAELISLTRHPPHAVLVTSVMTADVLGGILLADRTARPLAGAVFLCLSKRIAEASRGVGLAKIRVAPEPTETALISLL